MLATDTHTQLLYVSVAPPLGIITEKNLATTRLLQRLSVSVQLGNAASVMGSWEHLVLSLIYC